MWVRVFWINVLRILCPNLEAGRVVITLFSIGSNMVRAAIIDTPATVIDRATELDQHTRWSVVALTRTTCTGISAFASPYMSDKLENILAFQEMAASSGMIW
jgi:hypothetical protein